VTAARVLERNFLVAKRNLLIYAAGIFEPVFFLFSIGIGVGDLVGQLHAPNGHLVDYRDFVAPGLMAMAAMNGATFDTTIMFFVKLKYWKVFDTMLATPLSPLDVVLGEIAWAVARGLIYGSFFLATMAALGLLHSWMAVFLLPAPAPAKAQHTRPAAGGASFFRSYFDFDFVNVVLVPSFLFSGVFFELSRYPGWLATVVRCTPLYQGVALMRDLTFGYVGASSLAHAAYLALMGAVGVAIATRRTRLRLTP
jgi:lipooligosaccharide transport system permease protein